jgi:hypothetical protein
VWCNKCTRILFPEYSQLSHFIHILIFSLKAVASFRNSAVHQQHQRELQQHVPDIVVGDLVKYAPAMYLKQEHQITSKSENEVLAGAGGMPVGYSEKVLSAAAKIFADGIRRSGVRRTSGAAYNGGTGGGGGGGNGSSDSQGTTPSHALLPLPENSVEQSYLSMSAGTVIGLDLQYLRSYRVIMRSVMVSVDHLN